MLTIQTEMKSFMRTRGRRRVNWTPICLQSQRKPSITCAEEQVMVGLT